MAELSQYEISAGKQKFIDRLGFYYENYGIPRIGGKMLGLLLLADDPVSAEQVSRVLRVSRSSVSTNLKLLLSLGMIEIVQKPLERTDYFVFAEDAWENATRKRIEGFRELNKAVGHGMAAVGTSNEAAADRLKQMKKWTDRMMDLHQQMLDAWDEE